MGGNFSISWSKLILSALFLFNPKCCILRGEMDIEKSSQQWLTIGLSVAAEGLCPTRNGTQTPKKAESPMAFCSHGNRFENCPTF